ncbi:MULTISPECIES: hypothetical protein [Okeania]|uniref:hypothetical protein n=1 Tax=Okeania TaxID=1458928 RepID=UPI001374BE93|nr:MULTISPECIES: hypothetical protein [Okeania]NET18167.1 hypothetical protein [Okeania sp. SIO1H5]NET77424.1 hypothetical protein [Okeania sp. SIO1F9]NET92391.1 hypothetical protein [Okeania sp. SIO1H2]
MGRWGDGEMGRWGDGEMVIKHSITIRLLQKYRFWNSIIRVEEPFLEMSIQKWY